jgi:hypothetical protein
MSSHHGNEVEMRLDKRRGGLVAFLTINNSSRLNR